MQTYFRIAFILRVLFSYYLFSHFICLVYHYVYESNKKNNKKKVDILIGQDNSEALMPIEVRRGAEGSPFAVRTMLRWSLNGCVSTNVPSGRVTSNFVSANILDLKSKLPGNETTVHVESLRASVEEQEYSVVNQYPNTVVNLERITQNNVYIVIHRMAITLFMLFLLGGNICLCMFSLFNFTLVVFSCLKHVMLQWGECYLC